MKTSFLKSALFLFVFLGLTITSQAKTEIATFAGGCFWCMTPPFEKLDGVLGKSRPVMPMAKGKIRPTTTMGIRVTPKGSDYFYDPSKITYAQLVDVFWKQIPSHGSQWPVRGPGTPLPGGGLLSQPIPKEMGRKNPGRPGQIRPL